VRLGECAVGQDLVHRLAEQVEAVGGDVPPLLPMRSMVGFHDAGRGTDEVASCCDTRPLSHLHTYSNMSPTPIPINNVNHLPRMSKKQAAVDAHITMNLAGSKRQLIVPKRSEMQIDNAKTARLLSG